MLKARIRSSILGAGLIVLLVGVAAPPMGGWTAPKERAVEPEVSSAAAALLNLLNTGSEARLRATPGMTAEVLAKLMARRAAGGRLRNLVEFTKTTGVKPGDLETLLKPFQDEEAVRNLEAERKSVPDPPTGAKAGRLQRNGAEEAPPNPNTVTSSGEGPIGALRPGFYSKLPGFDDLEKVDPLKRTEFLETVNREMCSCGCKGETIAFCLVNDPGCPVVKARAKKIYDDIMTKAPK